MTSRRLRLGCQGSKDTVQVEPGEPPFEGRGDRAVLLAEGNERGLELGERAPLGGLENLALDEAEVDLDLVQPGRVDRRVDDPDLRPPFAQPGLGPGTAMRAADLDDPEDSPGAGVRLLAHDLVDEPSERRDPVLGLTAAEHLRSMDVPGRQIGKRAAPLVLVLDADRSSASRRAPGMDPGPCLDARLLA